MNQGVIERSAGEARKRKWEGIGPYGSERDRNYLRPVPLRRRAAGRDVQAQPADPDLTLAGRLSR